MTGDTVLLIVEMEIEHIVGQGESSGQKRSKFYFLILKF